MRLLAVGLLALIGCSDNPYDPNAPAVDPSAPKVHITSPKRGTVAGDVKTLTVTGTVVATNKLSSVTVDDVPATVADDGTFTATVPVTPGTFLLHAVAKDTTGNSGKESRAVVVGPMAKIDMQVPNAITATLSAQTFAAIGTIADNFITGGDLSSMLTASNPVFDVGGGPDCLYAMGAITSFNVGGSAISLVPHTGGLAIDAELDNISVGMHLSYAAACLDGGRDIMVSLQHVSVTGMLTVGVVNKQFDIHLDNPSVSLTGLDVDLGGIPGAVVDILDLNALLAPVLGWATEKFVVPMINTELDGLNQTKTISVLSSTVDISVTPASINFTSAGGLVELNTSIRAHGDSGKFVFVDNVVPAMDLSHGFSLAVADDAANQALASMWSAKGLDDTIDLKNGSYGDVGTLYDSVEIGTLAPPFVDASNTANGLVLTIGDLMATFRNGASVATEAAINAQVGLKVVPNADGTLRFDVGQPTVYVDVLDQGVDGANQLSNAQFEAITSFALARVISVGSASIGTIPLPAIGGVGVTDLAISPQTGYLVVAGDVQ